VLQAAPAFDPKTANRTFIVSMADQQTFMLLPRLIERLDREAPNIQIDVRPAPFASDAELEIGVWLEEPPANTHSQALLHEEFVCVVRKHSAASRGTLDRKRYLALPHLVVAPRGTPGSRVDDLLAQTSERRRVALRVPHFLVAPHIVATSDLIWTAPKFIAQSFVEYLPLVMRDVPFRIDGFTVTMRWHARLDRDPGLAWLRGVLREIVPS
jgi:DNA-binding transcriptional LysR family regulator